jgi:GT2 family glycosyltransferase
MAATEVSIIIVNWNSGPQLKTCIDSITQFGGDLVDKIIVIDNGSVDGSETLVEAIPSVTLIRAGKNLGFGKACNLGAKSADSEYLLFLNPDTRLFTGSLSKPVEFMQKPGNASIGVCGIQLVDANGNSTTSAARFPSLRVMVGKTLGLSMLISSVFPPHLLTSAELKESGVVDQVIGAFFLIRKSVFDSCSGFDEQFFVYFEEVDLALRVKQLGYTSYFLSDAAAFHKGGGCSDGVKAARLFYSLRSRILYAKKHYSRMEFAALILLTGIEMPMRLAQGTIRGSWADVKNTFAAYRQLVAFFIRRD